MNELVKRVAVALCKRDGFYDVDRIRDGAPVWETRADAAKDALATVVRYLDETGQTFERWYEASL